LLGSNYGGEADGHYGQSFPGFANPPYNITAVMHSLTGEAIASLLSPSFPDEEEMLQLRAKATLTCTVQRDSTPCDPVISSKPCLFDLEIDPCEWNNLADSHPEVLLEMMDLVTKYEATLVPQLNKPADVEGSDPRKFNNTWSPWIDT
jgi:arylsulfatase B